MNITILGAGAYALGLALRFNKNKNKIIIWSAVKEEIDVLTKTHKNEKALKGVTMPNNFIYTENIEKAIDGSDIVVLAVATKFLSSVCDRIKPYIKDKHIIIASKGIEQDTYMFASSIVRKKLKTKKLATISGPSFAKDMANDEACLQDFFCRQGLFLYHSEIALYHAAFHIKCMKETGGFSYVADRIISSGSRPFHGRLCRFRL